MVNLEQIKEAHKKISPYINKTPLLYSSYLSENKNVYLKLESYKLQVHLNCVEQQTNYYP